MYELSGSILLCRSDTVGPMMCSEVYYSAVEQAELICRPTKTQDVMTLAIALIYVKHIGA